MELKTSAFQPGEMIPSRYTCDGSDLSPDLSWSGVPEGTKSFALICDDPDAPSGVFTHWLLCGLPAHVTSLPEGMSKQDRVSNPACVQGMNDFRRVGYGGPCPPRGTKHRYFFKLFALDSDLKLKPRFSKKELVEAMKGHILAEAELMGLYQRK